MAMESGEHGNTVRFGVFQLDLDAHELRKNGVRVRLEDKLFQLLGILLDKAGRVVTRRALREQLWPDTHVRYEQGLNTAVNKLRESLGDSAQSPRFIETLPRVGYRFIAPVERGGKREANSEKKMLLVLPFQNLGADAGQEYFADGLTEEMISRLAQLNPRKIGVMARTSTMQYKGTNKTIAEIAQELNVSHVLEGSVRKEGDRLRITAQLIDAADQAHVWSGSYEHTVSEIFRAQDDVARSVGRALSVELLGGGGSREDTADPRAHEAYLRGRFLWGQRTEGSLKKALEEFSRALELAPRFARAYSGIADCSSMLCWYGAFTPSEAGPRAAWAADRAVELDASLAEGHGSLGIVRYWFEWNWRGAEEEFLRATELNPSFAQAHLWYAALLNSLGRHEEAAVEQRRAQELDPFSPVIAMNAADPLFFAGRYEEAARHLRGLLEQAPNFFPALFNLGRVYVQMGKQEEAITAFEKAVRLSGNREGLPALAHALAAAGRAEEARAILTKVAADTRGRYMAAPMIARIFLGLGEIDECFSWLQKGIEERSCWMVFLKADPVYEPIRKDSRYAELLARCGFSAAKAMTAGPNGR